MTQRPNEDLPSTDDDRSVTSTTVVVGDLLKMPTRRSIMATCQGRCQLAIADPPYNCGLKYDDDPTSDKMGYREYENFTYAWLTTTRNTLTSNGSLWVVIDEQNLGMMLKMVADTGFKLRRHCIWHYTFGQNQRNNFTPAFTNLLYCVLDPKHFIFNSNDPKLRVKSWRQKNRDPRANPDGRLPDNVWPIPRIVGNSKERCPWMPTQLPIQLVSRMVRACSTAGATVFDPFGGSGTTAVAANLLKRHAVLCERSRLYASKIMERVLALSPDSIVGVMDRSKESESPDV